MKCELIARAHIFNSLCRFRTLPNKFILKPIGTVRNIDAEIKRTLDISEREKKETKK